MSNKKAVLELEVNKKPILTLSGLCRSIPEQFHHYGARYFRVGSFPITLTHELDGRGPILLNFVPGNRYAVKVFAVLSNQVDLNYAALPSDTYDGKAKTLTFYAQCRLPDDIIQDEEFASVTVTGRKSLWTDEIMLQVLPEAEPYEKLKEGYFYKVVVSHN